MVGASVARSRPSPSTSSTRPTQRRVGDLAGDARGDPALAVEHQRASGVSGALPRSAQDGAPAVVGQATGRSPRTPAGRPAPVAGLVAVVDADELHRLARRPGRRPRLCRSGVSATHGGHHEPQTLSDDDLAARVGQRPAACPSSVVPASVDRRAAVAPARAARSTRRRRRSPCWSPELACAGRPELLSSGSRQAGRQRRDGGHAATSGSRPHAPATVLLAPGRAGPPRARCSRARRARRRRRSGEVSERERALPLARVVPQPPALEPAAGRSRSAAGGRRSRASWPAAAARASCDRRQHPGRRPPRTAHPTTA